MSSPGWKYWSAWSTRDSMLSRYTDILNMEIGCELLFHRGQKPLRTKRYDLFHDPLYAECQQMGKGSQTIVDDSGDVNLSLW